MRLTSTTARVARFAEAEGLFRRARRLLVAVSGGPDSLACLLVLLQLRERFGLDLTVAHFDHQLRAGSRDDLEFVRDVCGRLDVPFLSGEGDVRAAARQQRRSLEDAARAMRYRFLAFVAAEKRLDAIATGHTAGDQAETVLMRILRGTGVRGVRSMLPSSPVPGSPAQSLLRPLLVLSREETRAVCESAGIEPRDDQSNADIRLLRNRVRHEVLPALRAVNPSVDAALRGLAVSAREIFVASEREAMGLQPSSRGPLGVIFDLARFRALGNESVGLVVEREAAFFHAEIDVNRTRLENLRAVLRRGAGSVRFAGAVVEASAGQVRVGPPLTAQEYDGRVLNVPGVTLAGPWRVEVTTSEPAPMPGAALAAVDSGALHGALRARRPAPGDRMRYHGIVRKVADVLANAKVPAWDRLDTLVVADSTQVHVAVAGETVFAADHAGGESWHVRVGWARPPG
jgi:tRNA(Ile)-lysidine synthase